MVVVVLGEINTYMGIYHLNIILDERIREKCGHIFFFFLILWGEKKNERNSLQELTLPPSRPRLLKAKQRKFQSSGIK